VGLLLLKRSLVLKAREEQEERQAVVAKLDHKVYVVKLVHVVRKVTKEIVVKLDQ
jgi:hypothetical protein